VVEESIIMVALNRSKSMSLSEFCENP
jgi:hypothetical protein